MLLERMAIVLLAVAVSGCATRQRAALTPEQVAQQKQLDEKVNAVRVMKRDPPLECVDKGQVLGRSFSLAAQTRNMRVAALEKGANYIRLEDFGVGTAFACPASVLGEAPSGVAAVRVAPEQVRVMVADPPLSCQDVGQVFAGTLIVADQPQALREKAASKGANYVRLDSQGVGMAFRCPPEIFGGASTPAPSP